MYIAVGLESLTPTAFRAYKQLLSLRLLFTDCVRLACCCRPIASVRLLLPECITILSGCKVSSINNIQRVCCSPPNPRCSGLGTFTSVSSVEHCILNLFVLVFTSIVIE